MTIQSDIENIVANYCDGTWNGLENANFVEYDNPPQELADEITAYIIKLLTDSE